MSNPGGFRSSIGPGMGANYGMSPEGPNYENQDVLHIREQLGDFDYGD